MEMVDFLLSHGANINHEDSRGVTAMLAACSKKGKALSLVELLLEKSADPGMPTGVYGMTPLMMATLQGHESVVERLLHHPQVRTTLDHCSVPGKTALWGACWSGRGSVVKLLLEAGADPTITFTSGQTLMGLVREKGTADCLLLLGVRAEPRHDARVTGCLVCFLSSILCGY